MTIIVFLLLFIGLSLIFKFDIIGMLSDVVAVFSKPKTKKRKISEKRELMNSSKLSKFEQKKINIENILKHCDIKMDFNTFVMFVVICSLVGLSIGLLMKNVLLAIILMIGLGYLPMLFLQIKQNSYLKMINDKLEPALNAITSTYIQNRDITKAVSEVIDRIPQPLTDIFKIFLAETRYVNANIELAIWKMRSKINNQYFRQWCDTLIQCQGDVELRYSLPSTVEKMSDAKKMQNEYNTMIMDSYKEYSTVALIALLIIPLMYFMQREWFNILLTTTVGKIVLAVNIGLPLFGIARIIKINKPISVL